MQFSLVDNTIHVDYIGIDFFHKCKPFAHLVSFRRLSILVQVWFSLVLIVFVQWKQE